MATLPELIVELDSAHTFEVSRITGYRELLSFPDTLLTQDARREITEAVTWSDNREQLLASSINAVLELINNGYPERDPQFAAANVVRELQLRLAMMQDAVNEFHEIPEGHLTIGDEAIV